MLDGVAHLDEGFDAPRELLQIADMVRLLLEIGFGVPDHRRARLLRQRPFTAFFEAGPEQEVEDLEEIAQEIFRLIEVIAAFFLELHDLRQRHRRRASARRLVGGG